MLTTGEHPIPGSIPLPAFARARWPRRRAWLVAMTRWLAVWVVALAVTLVTVTLTLHPPFGHLLSIVQYLLIGGAASVAIGAAALWVTDVGRIGGMRLNFAMPPLLTALIISFNVMLVAHEMFLSAADTTLVLDILVFSVLLAMALSSSIAGTIAGAIRRVEAGARRIAAGEYSVRLPETELGGATELTQLGRWFNQMAASVEDAFASRQRAEHERRQIVAAVSHDLRTPLASVRAMIEAITDGVVTDPAMVSRYQRTIRAEVRHLSHLIDDLFELSRLEAGLLAHGGPRGELVALDDLISDALEAMGGQAAQRGVRLGGGVEGNLPPVVVDAGRIHRVLINLVQNALRHTAPGGRVAIHAQVQAPLTPSAPARVLVRVVDSGEGIAAADLPHIFEPTYRGESSRRWDAAREGERGESFRADQAAPTVSGAGLGLTIARGLVEAHGGAMWAESPLAREAAALLASDELAPEPPRLPDAASRLDHTVSPRGTPGHADVPSSGEGPGTCIAFTIPIDAASAPRGSASQ
jgi:signal transduction histidine kinase